MFPTQNFLFPTSSLFHNAAHFDQTFVICQYHITTRWHICLTHRVQPHHTQGSILWQIILLFIHIPIQQTKHILKPTLSIFYDIQLESFSHKDLQHIVSLTYTYSPAPASQPPAHTHLQSSHTDSVSLSSTIVLDTVYVKSCHQFSTAYLTLVKTSLCQKKIQEFPLK